MADIVMANLKNVLDLHGCPTSIVERQVYKIQTVGKILWAGRGGSSENIEKISTQPIGSGGNDWHKDSNECEWSLHKANSTNHYYIVTKGRILSTGHTTKAKGLGKNGSGKNLSEWHKTGPESQWMLEPVKGKNGSFRIVTSNKILWAEGGGESQGLGDIACLDKDKGSNREGVECEWIFSPKGTRFESHIYDMILTEDETKKEDAVKDGIIKQFISNKAEHAHYEEEIGMKIELASTSTFKFSEAASITLNYKASVTADLEAIGIGEAGATAETGTELQTSLKASHSITKTKKEAIELKRKVLVPPMTEIEVTGYSVISNMCEINFTASCNLKAVTLVAPENAFESSDPTPSYAKGDGLLTILKNHEFKTISKVSIVDNTATFKHSGTITGKKCIRSGIDIRDVK